MMVPQSPNAHEFDSPPGSAAGRQPAPSLVLTFPLQSGKVEAWRRFCQELAGSRHSMYAASRHRLGITREQMTLRDSPQGSAATTTLEAPDVARVLGEMILSPLPFENWYRAQLQALHGVRLIGYESPAPAFEPTTPPELIFDWRPT
jgi:hypothetical protein